MPTGCLTQSPSKSTVQDHGGAFEEVFGHADVGRGEIPLDGVVIHLFDAVHAVEVRQGAEHGRAYVRVQPLAEGEHEVVRRHLVAVVEGYALLEVERPFVYRVVGFPSIQKIGTRDVVLADFGQVLVDLAHYVVALAPCHARRVVDQLELHGGSPCAAALDRAGGRAGRGFETPARQRVRPASVRGRSRPGHTLPGLIRRAASRSAEIRADSLCLCADHLLRPVPQGEFSVGTSSRSGSLPRGCFDSVVLASLIRPQFGKFSKPS